MKKHFKALLILSLLSSAVFAQSKTEKDSINNKLPHLTFSLQNDAFYYTKGTDTVRQKLAVVDSSTIATLVDKAIAENNVAPQKLNVVLQGDDLMLHPKFDVLIDTILSRTVSQVRVKTNVF